MFSVPVDSRWTQKGVAIAGGHGSGNTANQLCWPCRICFDDNNNRVVIADSGNHRLMQWKMNDTKGYIVAGGNNQGNSLDELNMPTDFVIDKNTDSFIICDQDNQRVVRWSCHIDTIQGETLIKNIACSGLAIDEHGDLYVSDHKKHEVRRFRIGDKKGTVVAGGNGQGDDFRQLKGPTYLFVDHQQAVYVCDNGNDRIMKWDKGAKSGIIVAGGYGRGNSLTQLYWPNGIIVDASGTLYIADSGNHRVMRWLKGAKQGDVIMGGNGCGSESNQFNYVRGLSFDPHGNLYVADYWNHRIQKFLLE